MTKSQQTTDALELAAELALAGELPTAEQRAIFESAGVDYKIVHSILKEFFYDNEDDPEAIS